MTKHSHHTNTNEISENGGHNSDSTCPIPPTAAPNKRSRRDDCYASIPNYVLYGCRSVENYERIGRIDEGTYGVVSKARDKSSGEIVALKQVKMSGDLCKEGFPVTALRETNALLQLRHPNIIHVREMVVGSSSDKIYMVMEYAENDLRTLMQKKMKHTFLQSEVKTILQSLLSAVAYMHANWFIHRDLKTANLLYDKNGVLKVCDFGLARQYGDPTRKYTPLVVTLWYRAPELLLGTERYSTAVDMWSVGCIFAELLWMKPLFEGRGEMNQLDQIFRLLGPPTETTWPGFGKLPHARSIHWSKYRKTSDWRSHLPSTFYTNGISNAGFDLLSKMLTLNPDRRISAQDALQHEYFQQDPKPQRQDLMPTFP